jgi:polysaccharide deacetylase family protein (PEP-CTERM system associated)
MTSPVPNSLLTRPVPEEEEGNDFLAVQETWTPLRSGLPNALSCDVEDYFQVSAFEHKVPKRSWQQFECRIARNVDRVLEMFADANVRGTFFTLGWVAEHHPEVVRRIADAGHEIASHGMHHIRVWDQTPEAFRADISRAKSLLEDVSGQPVIGYRAASWSFDRRTPWAHRVLAEAGYRYSSSIYPVSHDHYGVPNAPVWPFFVKNAEILEIPASAVRVCGRNLPAAGGGYFRLLPVNASLWLIRRLRSEIGVPAVFYFHPWELDPGQPRMSGISPKTRFRHYLNLGRFESRLKRLLLELHWGRMDEIYFGHGP